MHPPLQPAPAAHTRGTHTLVTHALPHSVATATLLPLQTPACLPPRQRCFRTATFLPDVPPEQGWDVQQTIDALIRKAGCDARPTDDLRASLHLVRYQSTICSMDHAEWLGARGGSEAKAGRGPEVELLVESR